MKIKQISKAIDVFGYYTTSELASYLKVIPRTIKRWIKKGVLKPIKISNLLFFKKEDVENFIKSLKEY